MGVLLMLMTIGGLLVATVLLAISLIAKKRWLTKFVASGVAVWFAFYGVMLLGFSLTSTEKVLAAGEAKEYCGFYLDCHMHTSVTNVRTAKSIGDKSANGIFYIVNVKVFSDAKNPAIKMRLIEPKARVLMPDGSKLDRDRAAEALLSTAHVDLGSDITSRMTIEKELVFDLPLSPGDPKLLITDGDGIDRTMEAVMVGDEDSLFHAQTFFKLQEQNMTVGVK